jgi:hypothetical protein
MPVQYVPSAAYPNSLHRNFEPPIITMANPTPPPVTTVRLWCNGSHLLLLYLIMCRPTGVQAAQHRFSIQLEMTGPA